MGMTSLLRGSRKWTFLIAVAIVAITAHALSSLFPQSQYNYRQYASVAAQRWRTPPDIPKGVPSDDYLLNNPFRQEAPEAFLADPPPVSPESQALPVEATNPVPQTPPPQTTETKPHQFASADDFLPHFASLPSQLNLTVASAIGTCDYTETELNQFGYGTKHPWVTDHIPSTIIDAERQKWQHFILHETVPWSRTSSLSSGRGVVVVAGHPMAMKRFVVLVRALRDLGSKLPIELAFWGPEVNSTTQEALTTEFPTMHLHFNDLSLPSQVYHSPRAYTSDIHINFQLKLSALLNSRFAEPLLLDSDNFPVRDPSTLYDSATYSEYHSLFYPDIARTRPQNPLYAITNTPCGRDVYEFESGQLIVDKTRFWYHLQLADWFIGQVWYKDFLLGDKDTFRFAWNALRTEYGRPRKWVSSVGLSLPQPKTPLNEHIEGLETLPEKSADGKEVVREFCGVAFVQHHPDSGEVVFVHGGTLKSFSAPVLALLQKQDKGLFEEYKRSEVDERWSEIEYDVRLKFVSAGFVLRNGGFEIGDVVDAARGGDGANGAQGSGASAKEGEETLKLTDQDMASTIMCTDMAHVAPKPVREIGLGGTENAFERAGGYWMVEEGYRPGKSGA